MTVTPPSVTVTPPALPPQVPPPPVVTVTPPPVTVTPPPIPGLPRTTDRGRGNARDFPFGRPEDDAPADAPAVEDGHEGDGDAPAVPVPGALITFP